MVVNKDLFDSKDKKENFLYFLTAFQTLILNQQRS